MPNGAPASYKPYHAEQCHVVKCALGLAVVSHPLDQLSPRFGCSLKPLLFPIMSDTCVVPHQSGRSVARALTINEIKLV